MVTFVARQLEPYRGFHRLMRMLPLLQALRPRAHVILVGGDEVAYGQPPAARPFPRQCLPCLSNGALRAELEPAGGDGLLVDYFDAEALATTIAAVLADPQGHRPLGLAARATVVERYDLKRVCLPQQLKLVDAVAHRKRP